MVYVSPVSNRDKLNNLHISVLKKHGFLTKYIVWLWQLQKEVEESCYEFNKMLLFVSHCNDSVFDDYLVVLQLKLDKYLTKLREYWKLKLTCKYDGVRELFKGLGVPYFDEYDNSLNQYYGWSL